MTTPDLDTNVFSSFVTTIVTIFVLSGCAHAQPDRNRTPGVAPAMQQTSSVLLPGSYFDDSRKPLAEGDIAPDFDLPRISPGAAFPARLHLREAADNGPTLLVFWAFWCDTWKDVTHNLNMVRSRLDTMHARVVAVAVDASQQPVATPAMESGALWFPVGIDRAGGRGSAGDDGRAAQNNLADSVSARYGVRRVPTFFVLDANLRIRARFEGIPSNAALLAALRAAGRPG